MDHRPAIVRWMDLHRDWCFDLLRIYLGIGLMGKGLFYALNPAVLPGVMADGQLQFLPNMIGHYVIVAHLCGGLMLALGLLSRLAALAQIPILIGAVFFVHLREGFFGQQQNLELSMLVLFMLVLVALHGSGRWSLDFYLFFKKREIPAMV